MTTISPAGLWSSPITAAMIGAARRLDDVYWDSDGTTLVWAERQGRQSKLLFQQGDDAPYELTADDISPAGGVGYGGGTFTVYDGQVYFVYQGRLYRQALIAGAARAITPQFGRLAAPRVAAGGRHVAFVHSYEEQDCLAVVDCDGKYWPQKLLHDTDFVMQPAWHPDGTWLACVTWNHPHMPWIETQLNLLRLTTDGAGLPQVTERMTIGRPSGAAHFQPEFSPDGRYLAYVSDVRGWGQLYLYNMQDGSTQQLTSAAGDHGTPAWIQGMRTFAWTSDSRALIVIRSEAGIDRLYHVPIDGEAPRLLEGFGAYTRMEQIAVAPESDQIALIASAATLPERIVRGDGQNLPRIVQRATSERVSSDVLSDAQAITWTDKGGIAIHGLYYPPHNAAYQLDGVPPLIVLVHSGPTTQARAEYDLEVQFFTSRGFAVLQPNHRGSTGYGRSYMLALEGQWGVYDVEDCISGAQYLAEASLVDPDKMVIMGSSAGGFTVLQTLTHAPDVFKAGISAYGIADQLALSHDTHKFERYYNDWLIGSLPATRNRYRQRSPLYHADQIRAAVLLFHGTDDKVVPKNQSDRLDHALSENGTPHHYVVYDGEGHGFRSPETKQDYYTQILQFIKDWVN